MKLCRKDAPNGYIRLTQTLCENHKKISWFGHWKNTIFLMELRMRYLFFQKWYIKGKGIGSWRGAVFFSSPPGTCSQKWLLACNPSHINRFLNGDRRKHGLLLKLVQAQLVRKFASDMVTASLQSFIKTSSSKTRGKGSLGMKLGKLNYSGYRNQIHRNLCHRNKIRILSIMKLDFSVP